jgi:hypothetical protein
MQIDHNYAALTLFPVIHSYTIVWEPFVLLTDQSWCRIRYGTQMDHTAHDDTEPAISLALILE